MVAVSCGAYLARADRGAGPGAGRAVGLRGPDSPPRAHGARGPARREPGHGKAGHAPEAPGQRLRRIPAVICGAGLGGWRQHQGSHIVSP